MYKATIIVLVALVSLALGAAVKKEEIETKKDKRGLINLGYGYVRTPDYLAYPSKEYVFPHQTVTVEKHFQLPAPHVSVYNPNPIPLAVKVPDTTFQHLSYGKRYTYGISHPVFID